MAKWLRERGATEENPAVMGIGISVDEIERVMGDRRSYEHRVYPLIDLGLRRAECHKVIRDAGLPQPPKSSCYFCPFKKPQQWEEMRRDEPELFEKAAQFEDHLNRQRPPGRDAVFFTSRGKPLRDAIGEAQNRLPGFGDDSGMDAGECDEGVCFV